jgi:hypothetical protein
LLAGGEPPAKDADHGVVDEVGLRLRRPLLDVRLTVDDGNRSTSDQAGCLASGLALQAAGPLDEIRYVVQESPITHRAELFGGLHGLILPRGGRAAIRGTPATSCGQLLAPPRLGQGASKATRGCNG